MRCVTPPNSSSCSHILVASAAVQDTISGFARNNFSSPEFDPAYVRAKELEAIEREAEEKAKASLLQFSQHDVSHEMVMKNGFMVRKTSTDSDTSSSSLTSPPGTTAVDQVDDDWSKWTDRPLPLSLSPSLATSYPFTDKSRKIAPSPAAVKAVARFQQQLGASLLAFACGRANVELTIAFVCGISCVARQRGGEGRAQGVDRVGAQGVV